MNSDFGNKDIFSKNLKRQIELSGKSRRTIMADLGVTESSFNGWCRGEYYPRIDKIEMLADYFGCTKTDLIERTSESYLILHTEPRKEICDFLISCSDKDARVLLTLVRTLKGSDE